MQSEESVFHQGRRPRRITASAIYEGVLSGDSCNDAHQTSGFEYFYGEKLAISTTEIVCC